MKNRLILTAPSIGLALLVLLISVLRATNAKLVFGQDLLFNFENASVDIPVSYELPDALEVYPDSMFWKIKAFEDKMALAVTLNDSQKARLMRQHSDDRLVAAVELLKSGDTSLGLSYLFKAEEYLFDSFKGLEDPQELELIALAALKHRVVLEEVLIASPESVRPQIVSVLDKAKLTYKESAVLLDQVGTKAPENPFDKI